MQRVLAGVLVISLCSGCTPATGRAAGAGIIIVGAMSAFAGADLLAPCSREATASNGEQCVNGAHPGVSNAGAGFPLVFGGLSLIAIGVVLATGIARPARPFVPAVSPAPPESEVEPAASLDARAELPPPPKPSPFPLDVQTACGLTGRYLDRPVLVGGVLDALRVVSCRGPIVVADSNAQLTNVYLRAASTMQEQNVTVCFEHHAEWVVVGCGNGFDP